ncbi:hypothetical protein SAY87_004212 [Trapa incisa]|uniref:GTD-binding domain-containing protein n=1 Tax=Trapa incisa TaxID=236973 RepID=A0AAN7JP36_9MYRT|nr:hypothetical protein SAY87_004212 [Trapa incisa]
MCESHKREISSLAYCHVHKKLSDIRQMCEGCLLSYATEKQSECDTYKSLVGILHKDLDFFIQDESVGQLLPPVSKKPGSSPSVEPSYKDSASDQRCCCCGEPLRVYSSSNLKGGSSHMTRKSKSPSPIPHALVPSPRAASMTPSDLSSSLEKQGKVEGRASSAPPFMDSEEVNEVPRTPSFSRHKLFGVPLSDSVNLSPRWSSRSFKRPLVERMEFAPQESMDVNIGSIEPESLSIMNQLKKQVRLDGKSLLALYMELDEEKSASEVAANNAMAMITRLQAEKAAVQIEALQYQRMMEEQAEYDQEALQETNDLLDKREDELKILEAELEVYRKKFGCLKEGDYQLFKVRVDEEYETLEPHYSFFNGESDSECDILPDYAQNDYQKDTGRVNRSQLVSPEGKK